MADVPSDDAASGDPGREDRVDDAIASYLEAVERGEAPDVRAYIAQHPDIASELSLFFADRAEFQQAVGEMSPAARAINDGPVSLGNTPVPGPDQPTLDYHERPAGGAKPMPKRFGDYELLEEIARGGMGVVYKARQVMLNRIVAIKMILAGQMATTQDVKRFHTEAEAATDLDHPNIVPIYEVGQHDGQHYFAMAYVEGPSLAARVAEGPLPPREAAELVKTVAGALHYAHERGLIHRDLKPGNILLQTGREVSGGVVSGKNAGANQTGGSRPSIAEFIPKVTDFGLARRLEADSSLTGTGQILGTPSYMPPEQALAKFDQIGPASDNYSLGAVLYCLVTGQPPFLAASAFETLVQVLEQEPVPPRRLNPSLPRDLEAICLKCLRKAPEERYASAAELAADLRRFLAGEPVGARRIGMGERIVKWVKRRPTTAALVGLTFVAMVCGAILAVRGAAERALADAEKAASRMQAQTNIDGLLTALPAAVPLVVERLRPLKEFALPLLRERLGDVSLDGTRRLRAAYALADQDEAPLTFLLDAIPTAPQPECRNLLAAIGHAKTLAISEVLDRARSSGDRAVKSRYAIVALQLGNPTAAQEALALRGNPADRTAFIETYADWHGELRGPLRLLRDTEDEAFRSGICSALGAIPPEELDPSDFDVVTCALEEIFDHAPHGGTHSASAWALGRYGRTPPPIEPTPSPPVGRRWFVNGHGMTLVEVPPGEFEMGLPQAEIDQLIRSSPEQADQRYFPRSTPQHHVRLTNRFYLGAYEVTQGQYQEIMGINPSHFSEGGAGKGLVAAGVDTRQHPVEMVSWFDAVDFCNKLSEKEGLPPYYARVGPNVTLLHGNGYRLPTEAEWEFACRAGTIPPWSFGDDERNLTRHAWFVPDSRTPTQGVGELPPNPYGLHDLYGSVDEWCWDWAADYAADSVTDPLGPSVGANRVLRGCAVDSLAQGVRSAHRAGRPPFERRPNYGLRVARTIEVDDAALIASNLVFANAQMAQGNPRAALPSYGRAIMTIEQLEPEKLSELATQDLLHQALNGFGNAQQQLGDYPAALASHEKALSIAQARAAEQPENVEYEIGLAGSHCNIGNAQGMLERSDDAISSYGRADALLDGVLGRDPKNALARLYLRNTHWGHAQALGRLNRHAEAAENWRQAAELDDGKYVYIRIGYAESLARAGDHVAAAAEARQLAKNPQLPGDQLYALVRVFSISAAVARNDATLAEEYALEAVDLLKRAQTAGWLSDARNLAALGQDADLSCLRDRDDFRKLVAMAIDDGTAAIRLDPNPALGFKRRGELFATNNEPSKAADDFARAYGLMPDDVGVAQNWCNTLVGSGNITGYRAACTRLRERFGMSDDPRHVLVLCRVLILSPEAVEDKEFLVQLGKKAVLLDPGTWWPRHVLSGAYVRNGQYEEALSTLDEIDVLNLVTAAPSVDPWLSQILNDSLRAIALLKLGRASEARLVLERVDESSEQHLKSAPGRSFGEITPVWWNWYPIQTFRREAEELLVGNSSESDTEPESANPAAGAFTGLFFDVMRNTTTGVDSPPWLVVSSTQFGHLNLIAQDAKGKGTTPLTKDFASATEPSWSPDGGEIAFTSYSHGGSRLQLLEVEGLKVTPLDVSTAYNRGACWSPDGRRIAFTSNRSGNWDIHLMDADGKNVVNLTSDPGYDADAAWSPDGTKIAFASNRTGVFRLWLMNVDGTNPVDLLRTDQLTHLYPAWSPNGKQLTFGGRGDDDTVQLFVVNADGTSPVQLTNAGAINTYSAWSPDGKHLAYLRLGVPDAVSGVAPVGDLMIYDTVQRTHSAVLMGSAWARPCWNPVVRSPGRSK